MHRLRLREGFALAIAMIGIVVIGTLIAGAFFTANQEFRLGRNQLIEQRAFEAAEYGLNKEANDWNKVLNIQMANGAMRTDTFSTGDSTFAVVRVTRLNDYTFWAVSEGFAGVTSAKTTARRRLSRALRIAYPSFDIRAALTVRGQVEVQGSSKVDGNDSIPYQWSGAGLCPPPGVSLAGVMAPDTTKVCSGTCPGTGDYRLSGNPPEYESPVAADTATYIRFGDETWQTLTANADVVVSGGNWKTQPSVSGGRCNKADNANWGDPWRTTVCADYFPIVWVKGSLKLQAGSIGQGVLLIEGDMEMAGGFEYNGIVVVRDDIKSNGTGNKISGAAFAGNSYISDNTAIAGNAEIRYSSCAVERAAKGASMLIPAKQRGWAELF